MFLESTNTTHDLEQNDTHKINNYMEIINSFGSKNKNSTEITVDISSNCINEIINWLFNNLWSKRISVKLHNWDLEIWNFLIESKSNIELIKREIFRLRIWDIQYFPIKIKEILEKNEEEKLYKKYYDYLVVEVTKKTNSKLIKDELSIKNKNFYKEIYLNKEYWEFIITILYLLECYIHLNKYNFDKMDKKLSFKLAINSAFEQKDNILNRDIIINSFDIIKKYWNYADIYKNELTI